MKWSKEKNTRNAPQIIQKISKLWTEKNDRHINIITRYKARDNDIDRNQKAQSKPIFTIFETQGSIEVAEKDDLVINKIDKGGAAVIQDVLDCVKEATVKTYPRLHQNKA